MDVLSPTRCQFGLAGRHREKAALGLKLGGDIFLQPLSGVYFQFNMGSTSCFHSFPLVAARSRGICHAALHTSYKRVHHLGMG